MHDIGKIGIPVDLLKRAGQMSNDEFDIMKQHVEIGGKILNHEFIDSMARNIALYHHEWWNGHGYLKGLKKEAIPLEARIVTLADVYDALITERPYKKAWTVDDACALLVEQKEKHFDPHLVDLFLGCMPQILDVKERWAEHAATPL